jgi:hypothetical protein
LDQSEDNSRADRGEADLGKGDVMGQFYIRYDSEAEARRCHESRDARVPITVMGQTAEGAIKVFAGVVQSVDYDPTRDPGRRFRVTMRDQVQTMTGRSRDRASKPRGTASPVLNM